MATDEGRLFDPPPPVVQPATELYRPKVRTRKGYNPAENVRVRQLFKAHIAELVTDLGTTDGKERGAFAHDLVLMAERDNVRYYEGRVAVHAKGSDAPTDSVRTQLRQFWEDTDLPDYMLVLVETVICTRKDMPYPPAYYSLQRRMVDG